MKFRWQTVGIFELEWESKIYELEVKGVIIKEHEILRFEIPMTNSIQMAIMNSL